MTTWTESARSSLEGHLAKMRESLATSGADPAEVTDDLRRHIDHEVAARRLGVVTMEDVETILQRIGLPAPPIEGEVSGAGRFREHAARGPAPAPPVVPRERPRPAEAAAPRTIDWHPWLFVLGVLLPASTLALELLTHMCAETFFDPIPGVWDILLVASIPLVNFAVWYAVCHECRSFKAANWLGVAIGYSLGVSGYYSLLYAPLAPLAAFAVFLFGWGLLPLSPFFAWAAAWRLLFLANRIPGVKAKGGIRDRTWVCGLGLAALALGLVVLPPVLTRHWSRLAASEDSEGRSRQALRWLRAYGDERTLLADCYGTTSWGRDVPFGFHAQGTPLPAQMARGLFFRVTGHAFNEFPPPQANYRGRGWDALGDVEWDADQGGTTVGGRLRGLSLGQSRLDGLVDGDAGWAYTEWILEFKNVAGREHEARAQIALPPGGVVSRVTLWVNGEEREAAFAGSSDVRAAYENVVKVVRRDPVLVTEVGEDRVMMQCYPVPANGGTIKVRLGITAPVEVENASNAIVRWPRFVERNFGLAASMKHTVWVQSAQALTALHPKLARDASKPGVFALRGELSDGDLTEPTALVRVPRSSQARSAWVPDPHGAEGQFVRQELIDEPTVPPQRIVLVLDTSKSMEAFLPTLAESLSRLPEGIEFSLLLARDGVEEFSGTVRKLDAGSLAELCSRLRRVGGLGGQDNLPAVVRAWDLASERTNSAVLWIHGPQPIDLGTSETLQQRLTWHTAGAEGAPRFHDLQIVSGVNRVTAQLAGFIPVQALPRYASVNDDLQRLFARWRGEGSVFRWQRERLPADALAESQRGMKSSKHLTRLWAKDAVIQLVAARQRAAAVALAAKYQLVTAVSGAVVLETQQQFDQAGLKPVAAETVPVVPEPGVMALLALGGGAMMARWWIKRRRNDRAIP